MPFSKRYKGFSRASSLDMRARKSLSISTSSNVNRTSCRPWPIVQRLICWAQALDSSVFRRPFAFWWTWTKKRASDTWLIHPYSNWAKQREHIVINCSPWSTHKRKNSSIRNFDRSQKRALGSTILKISWASHLAVQKKCTSGLSTACFEYKK